MSGSVEQLAVVAVAGLVAIWPQVARLFGRVAASAGLRSPQQPPAIGYESAIHSLAEVRKRLVSTGLLTDEVKKSFDSLTLALVAGSDK